MANSDSSSLKSDESEERSEDVSDLLHDLLLSDIEVSGRELGVGSYSSVLELSYKGLKCAGKRLHKTLYDQGLAIGPEILERFGAECELLSQLRHPKMVQFLGLHFEEDCDVPILVLEYMSNALSDCIEQYGVLPNEISYSILQDVGLGLHYLHSRAPVIIHRDLTANNVLLTPNMTAKISDLGMAKIINISPAQMTRHMTVCPGTQSYMPPEALTANPQYDTKLDCFSFGVLTTHVFCGEWPIGSEYLQADPKNPGHLYPLTEIQRREKYLKRLGSDHPLLALVHRCLKNLPSERPNAQEILEEVKLMAAKYPATYENRVDVLNQIKADHGEREELREELGELRCTLHEKEHMIENLNMTSAIEMERLKEQVTKLEQTNALQDMQLGQLQAENSRLQLLLASKRNELELSKKRERTLNSELAMANSKLEEKATQSLEKLKQLQVEVTRKSQEREEALKRLTSNQLVSGLRVSLGCHSSTELSSEYDDFFLSNADDIAELLKRLPSSSSSSSSTSTHFQAQQMVCYMLQDCYDHCKRRVMALFAEQLNTLFSIHTLDDHASSLSDLSIAYGLLLKSCVVDSQQLCDSLCQEIFPKFLDQHSLRLSSRTAEATLRHHMTHACKLTLDLVTSWPPLIVAQPGEFCEEWHDREYQYWDKSPHRNSGCCQLFYTRPVLFQSYEGNVSAKGWVGNRDKAKEVDASPGHKASEGAKGWVGSRDKDRGVVSPSHRASRKKRNRT